MVLPKWALLCYLFLQEISSPWSSGFFSLHPDYNFPTISLSTSRWSLSITFLSYLYSLCLMTKLFDSKGLGGCIEQAWATLFSHPCILYTLWILQPSVQIGDCVLALRLNVRGVRKLSYLASVNGELFIHYKRLLLASSKSKAVFGDIVLLLSLLFTKHLVLEIQALKSWIFRGKVSKSTRKLQEQHPSLSCFSHTVYASEIKEFAIEQLGQLHI